MSDDKKNASETHSFGLVPLSTQVSALAKTLLGKRGFSNADLLMHWSDVVGEDLANGMKPDKISYPKGTHSFGILHVRVATGSFALIVEHQKKIILDRINSFLGYDAFSDLKIKQDLITLKSAPIPKQEKPITQEETSQLEKKLENIEDPVLKEKLYNIGKSIFFK